MVASEKKNKKPKKTRKMTVRYFLALKLMVFICWVCGCKINGRENIPKDSRIVIVANHASLCDPILVGIAFPYQIYFLAKAEFSKISFLRILLNAFGVIFIKRGEPDITALRKAVAVSKEGKAVGLFPEGRRYAEDGLTDFKQGAVFIAQRTDAAILPVGLINAKHLFKFWRRNVTVNIGKPICIDYTDTDGAKLQLRDIMDKYTPMIKKEIEALT